MTVSLPSTGLPTVIYIAGAARSGSTLLNILLTQHRRVVSGGELFQAANKLQDPKAQCTCREPVAACPVWRGIAGEIEALAGAHGLDPGGLGKLLRRFDSRRALAGYLGNATRDAGGAALYAEAQHRIFRALRATKPGAAFVVDASKSQGRAAGRPLALHRLAGMDVRVIHLVRNPRGVLASKLKGWNRELEQGIRERRLLRGPRALINWWLANYSVTRLTRAIGRDRVIYMDYEALVGRPAETLQQLGDFLGLDPREMIDAAEGGTIEAAGHAIAGNRMRFHPVRLEPQHAAAAPPWYYRGLCTLAAWALARLAGAH